MADVADYTQAVNVTGGSVTILGTASVSISGTPTVAISGTPTVNVGNTPSVSITSGSVTATISGTPNINIAAQAVTLAMNQVPSALPDLTFPAGANTTQATAAVPAGTHSLIFATSSGASMAGLKVTGHQTGLQYWPASSNAMLSRVASGSGGFSIAVPINSAADTTYDMNMTTAGAVVTVKVTAVLDAQTVVVVGKYLDPVPVAAMNGVRMTAFSGAIVAVGTYTYDTPILGGIGAAPTFLASGFSGLGIGGRVVVYTQTAAGAGTVTTAIAHRDTALSLVSGNFLTSAAAAGNSITVLRAGPGLASVANVSANELVGLQVRVTLVVATASNAPLTDIDLL